MGSPHLIYGVVVKRLRHRPFTAVTMGSIPSDLTNNLGKRGGLYAPKNKAKRNHKP